MDIRLRLLIFFVLVCLQIGLDNNMKKCKNIKGRLLLAIHHFLQIYSLFGSVVFGYHKLHIISLLIALLVHYVSGRCFITNLHDKLCDLKESRLETFLNHILRVLKIKYNPFIYYGLLIAVLIYDILWIYPNIFGKE